MMSVSQHCYCTLLAAAAAVVVLIPAKQASAFVAVPAAARTGSLEISPHVGSCQNGNTDSDAMTLSRVRLGLSGRPIPSKASAAAVGSGCTFSGGKRPRFGTLQLSMSSATVEVSEGGSGRGEPAAVGEEFDVKTDLLNQIDLATSSKKRTAVNELMLKLEPMNPTESPARSPILNGVWEFLYTGGLSPGTLAVQVLSRVAKTFSAVVDLKSVTLTVKRDQPRVEAAVKATVFSAQAQVKVRTRLEQRSDMRLQEVYEEAEVAGVKIPIPSRIQPRRTLFITYLDDDIMIARDDSGAPDLLIRKEKEFRFNTGTPSASEDDSSPGSG